MATPKHNYAVSYIVDIASQFCLGELDIIVQDSQLNWEDKWIGLHALPAANKDDQKRVALKLLEFPNLKHLENAIIARLRIGKPEKYNPTQFVLDHDRHGYGPDLLAHVSSCGWLEAWRYPVEEVFMLETFISPVGKDREHNQYWQPQDSFEVLGLQMALSDQAAGKILA